MEGMSVRGRSDAGLTESRAREVRQRTDLPEEPLAATSSRGGVVDVDVVVLGTNRLLNERFLEDLAVHLHVIFPLHQVTLWDPERANTASCHHLQ